MKATISTDNRHGITSLKTRIFFDTGARTYKKNLAIFVFKMKANAGPVLHRTLLASKQFKNRGSFHKNGGMVGGPIKGCIFQS
jgi:hypothetical protein